MPAAAAAVFLPMAHRRWAAAGGPPTAAVAGADPDCEQWAIPANPEAPPTLHTDLRLTLRNP